MGIAKGEVKARVAGSELYTVQAQIKELGGGEQPLALGKPGDPDDKYAGMKLDAEIKARWNDVFGASCCGRRLLARSPCSSARRPARPGASGIPRAARAPPSAPDT